MNKAENTVISDRGSAILPALATHFTLSFNKPCPVHIERNLNSNGFKSDELHSLYWEATTAKSEIECDKVKEKIRNTNKGSVIIILIL